MKTIIQKISNLLLVVGIMVITFNLDVIKADPITEYQLEFADASSVTDNVVTYVDGETTSGTVNLYTQGEENTPINITDNGGHYESSNIENGSSYILNTDASEGYYLCSINIDGNPVSSEDINAEKEYAFNSYNANNERIRIDVVFATNCNGEPEPSDEYQLEFTDAFSVEGNVVTYKDGETVLGTVNLYIQGEESTPINITDNGGHYESSNIENGSSYILNTDASEGYYLCSINIDGNPVSSENINGDGEYTFNNYNANNNHIMIDVVFATDCNGEPGPSGPSDEYQLEFADASSVTSNIVTYADGETTFGTVNLYTQGGENTPINITNNGGHYESSNIENGSSYILNTDASEGYSLCSISIDGTPVSSEDINGAGEYAFNDYNANNSHVMINVIFATDCNGEPELQNDFVLEIGGTTIIDETNKLFTESGEGFTLTQNEDGYILNLTDDIEAIETTGRGSLIILGNDYTIGANEDGYSIYTDGKAGIEYGIAGGEAEDSLFNLEGGIHYSEDEHNDNLGMYITDVVMNIGTEDNRSTKGIEIPGNVNIWFSEINVYTTDYILNGVKNLSIVSGGELNGNTTGTAFNNMVTSKVSVSSGGILNTTFTTRGSSFNAYSSYYAPTENIDSVHIDDITDYLITFEEGTHSNTTNKYTYTSNNTTLNLQSTAKKLYTISYGMDGVSDTVVLNGRVQILAGAGYSYADENAETSTDYAIEEGTLVTIRLLPNYGYQYKSGGLNGNMTTAGATTGSYTFTMPNNHLHLSAIFEEKSNIVTTEAENIVGGSIDLATQDKTNFNGNIKLTVEDNEEVDAADYNVDGYQIGTILDLTLDQVVLKNGASDLYWSSNITELDHDMTVKLQLADELKNKGNYKVIRDHDGVKTTIDATYNEETGELEFLTNQYSTYAIAYEEIKDYTVTTGDFTISFEDGDGQDFTLGVLDLLNLTDEELTESSLTREEYNEIINEVKDKLKDYGTLEKFYDITVSDGLNEKTTGPFTFKLKLTEEQLKKYNTFKLINIEINEDVEVNEVITGKVEDGYLIVTLPHLSNYALVASNIESPKTSDSIMNYVFTGTGSLIMLVGAYLYLKKH